MDKFGAMRAFVRVVEAGTFTRAADSLDVPKAQVTRLVQSLEAELKTLLLNRTTRRVTVTTDGAAYYQRAVRLLDELEELESSLSHAKANPRGRLRIDVPSATATMILIPAMEDFCTRYPDIQVDIGVSDRTVDLIGENVDCVLRAGELTDPSLVARRIGDIHRIACASPAYLARFGVPEHPSDLEDERHRVINYFSHGSERFTYALQRGDERHEIDALVDRVRERFRRDAGRRPGRPGHRAHGLVHGQASSGGRHVAGRPARVVCRHLAAVRRVPAQPARGHEGARISSNGRSSSRPRVGGAAGAARRRGKTRGSRWRGLSGRLKQRVARRPIYRVHCDS
jgi:DNA-binding transcriptional LysR family regulator